MTKLRSKNVSSQPLKPGSGAHQLLLTAEQLFAAQGFEAVSTRIIAREAGQKNSSALHYHFGDKQGLLLALLEYRLAPINLLRADRLKTLLGRTRRPEIEELVAVFIEPMSEQLRLPVTETGYLALLSQLYAYKRGRELYSLYHDSNRVMYKLSGAILRELEPRPQPVVHMRLQFMGRQTITALAEWDDLRRNKAQEMSESIRVWRTEQLVRYITYGLLAP